MTPACTIWCIKW